MGKTIYTQKFRIKWKSHPKLRNWIMEDESNNTIAYCKFCKCNLKCKLCDLLMHADTKKHITRSINNGVQPDETETDEIEQSDTSYGDVDEIITDGNGVKCDRELRNSRQKFCSRWEEQFSWLKPDKVDETLGICVICNKYLVCKKGHLERHENSVKHRRMLNSGEMASETEMVSSRPNATEFMECGKREVEDDYEVEQDCVVEKSLIEGADTRDQGLSNSLTSVQKQKLVSGSKRLALNVKLNKSPPLNQTKRKLDRLKLLRLIDQDRHQLNEYFYSRPQQVQPRDSFDLFFESVSASVKTLPPKLAAEVKNRVSQIMTEFELRAISEREAQERSIAQTDTGSVVVSSTALEAPRKSLIPVQEEPPIVVPNIIYTFQPKLSDN